MPHQQDYATAKAIIDKFIPRIVKIAQKYKMSITFKNESTELTSDWEEYRAGFRIMLNASEPLTVHFWSIVTDLKSGSRQQFIAEKITLNELETTLDEGITAVEAWLAANEGIDPLEMARQRAGTAYYWSYEYSIAPYSDDGYPIYSAEFQNEWSGEVTGCEGDYEASLYDQHGHVQLQKSGEDSKQLMLAVEEAYKKINGDKNEKSNN